MALPLHDVCLGMVSPSKTLRAEAPYRIGHLHRLISGIEKLPKGATGALVFTEKDQPQGTILIEEGRVCWAAASEMENRLTDILRSEARPPLPKEVVEDAYEECRRENRPLGEILVGRGIVSRDGLKVALRQHSAEAIAKLSTARTISPIWASNRKKAYDAEFTFTTGELLIAVLTMSYEAEAKQALIGLRETIPEGEVGIAFLSEARPPMPLAQVGASEWQTDRFLTVGEWALTAIEVDGHARSSQGSESWEAWENAGLVYAWGKGRQ